MATAAADPASDSTADTSSAGRYPATTPAEDASEPSAVNAQDRLMPWPDQLWPQHIGLLAILDSARAEGTHGHATRAHATRRPPPWSPWRPEAGRASTQATIRPRPAIAAATKVFHTLAWLSIESCVVYVLWAGFAGRSDRRAGLAAAVVAGETLVFAGNGFRCPLTGLAERYGAERGSVTDLPAESGSPTTCRPSTPRCSCSWRTCTPETLIRLHGRKRRPEIAQHLARQMPDRTGSPDSAPAG
jgi:hypothetical protein